MEKPDVTEEPKTFHYLYNKYALEGYGLGSEASESEENLDDKSQVHAESSPEQIASTKTCDPVVRVEGSNTTSSLVPEPPLGNRTINGPSVAKKIPKKNHSVPRTSCSPSEPSSLYLDEEEGRPLLLKLHSQFIRNIHRAVTYAIQVLTRAAIRFPRITLIGLSCLSVGLPIAGYLTNFTVETSTADLWAPTNSRSLEDALWIWLDSHFTYSPVTVDVIIHKNGETKGLLGREGIDRVFEVISNFTSLGRYKEGCAWAEEVGDLYQVGQCWIHSVAEFWDKSYAIFDEKVTNDNDVIQALSQPFYPTGVMVDANTVMGKTQWDTNRTLLSTESYSIKFGLPWSDDTLDFEEHALEQLLMLRDEWKARGDEFRLEVRSFTSFSREYQRAIQNDLWLVPLAFTVVAIFTVIFAFGEWDRVKSRALLGIGAVVTIVASMMTSFGILFCSGVPFTTQTLMVPFLMFGIGLDDTYIIYGSYYRRSHMLDVKERISSTMEDVGVGIFITSLTSMLAFILGSLSNIPAVRWLCMYAYPCIGFDFLYQITFFMALLILDEQRIQHGRMDCCTCITVRSPSPDSADEYANQNGDAAVAPSSAPEEKPHVADVLMAWWADQLFKPFVQMTSFLAFVTIMVASIYCSTKLHQEFDFVDLVPADSYLKNFYAALTSYTKLDGVYGQAYFRSVDQSDPLVQMQMLQFVDDLVAGGGVVEPAYFWLRDFQKFASDRLISRPFQNKTFDDQIAEFLSVDIFHELYDEDIGRTKNGKVMETRVPILIRTNIHDSRAATDMLFRMREISGLQPINQNEDELKFFTYSSEYHQYEFYNQVIQELTFSCIMSVVAVSVVALFFIPHWTAVLFVIPFISFLFVNMLGYLYLSGIQINAISYVTLVMSIGMMIDYIIHILMRYYESPGPRHQRVHGTMSSIGASVFLGAASTFLGVICLSLSTSDLLKDIFVAVVGLIAFGVMHGLIFLPIALLHLGPKGKEREVLPEPSENLGQGWAHFSGLEQIDMLLLARNGSVRVSLSLDSNDTYSV